MVRSKQGCLNRSKFSCNTYATKKKLSKLVIAYCEGKTEEVENLAGKNYPTRTIIKED